MEPLTFCGCLVAGFLPRVSEPLRCETQLRPMSLDTVGFGPTEVVVTPVVLAAVAVIVLQVALVYSRRIAGDLISLGA